MMMVLLYVIIVKNRKMEKRYNKKVAYILAETAKKVLKGECLTPTSVKGNKIINEVYTRIIDKNYKITIEEMK